jgi:hypothetical protein
MTKNRHGDEPSPAALSRWENEGGALKKRLKRPRDPVQLGKLVGDILTGQVEDAAPAATPKPIDPALEYARKGGLKGGKARAAKLGPEKRAQIAKKAAAARWTKRKAAR